MLTIDEIIDHAPLNRPRPVQRVQRRQIFDSGRLVAPQNVAHAMRFELEDGRRIAPRKKFVSFRVIEREIIKVDLHASILFNHAHRVVEHGQRRKA